ncbi:TPA: autotransporter outer membrane beta-barrel domain-containing protein, partial [Burkholderia lata]
FSNRNASSQIDGATGLVYGAFQPQSSAAYVMGMAGFGYWDNQQTRTVSDAVTTATAKSSFGTSAEALYVEAGLKLESRGVTFDPYAALRFGHYAQNAYTEQGGDLLDLTTPGATNNAFSSLLGVRITGSEFDLVGKKADVHADLAWEHRLNNPGKVMGMAFESDPKQAWQLWATPSDRDAGRVSVGLDIATTKTMTVHLNLNGEVGTSTSSYGGQVGVQWKW